VAALAVPLTHEWRRARRVAGGLAGFLAGSYPIWAWNAEHGWATLDFFRRGGKQPAERLAGLPDRPAQVAARGFPQMFGLTGAGIGPRFSFLSEGRLILSGELGPDVSWVHGAHAERVRTAGPDALVVDQPGLARALERRLDALGVRHERTDVDGFTILHRFSRRVALEELSGYDTEERHEGGDQDERVEDTTN